MAEVEAFDQFVGASARSLAQTGEATDQLEVLDHGEVLVEPRELASHPDAAAHLRRSGHRVDSVDQDPATLRPDQCRQNPDQCRLACSVVAEHPQRRPATHPEIDTVECRQGAVVHGNVRDLHCEGVHLRPRPSSSRWAPLTTPNRSTNLKRTRRLRRDRRRARRRTPSRPAGRRALRPTPCPAPHSSTGPHRSSDEPTLRR